MDKNYLKAYVKNVDTQLFEIINNLICSICQELFNKPVTTPCGHSFCDRCIKRVLSSRNNNGCPLCKNVVKRYGLEKDAVKSTLITISKELPAAFGRDVEELTESHVDLGEDLIKTSKLFHFYNQEYAKESITSKPKSTNRRKTKKTDELKYTEVGSGSFIPVLKRTKNVLEYASAKKKKMDDLISISQTEPASNSSLCESSDLDKKLENIEKIPLEKKVNEWFNAVGDNIYINSPSSSILEGEIRNLSENDKEENRPTMIRRDYKKPKVFSKNEYYIEPVDPYEFVSSQNNKNNSFTKKRQKKSTDKRIPDFKALQSFSKENIKRNSILFDHSKGEVTIQKEIKDPSIKTRVTASQKFDQLLSETKKLENKPHVLYSTSQSSSTHFLDVSLHSKVEEKYKRKKFSKSQKNLLGAEDILFKNFEVFTEGKEEKTLKSKKRGSASTPKSGKKKKLFSEIMEMKSDEASQLEESIEKYLITKSKKIEPPSTKLGKLLTELLDDDIIYATRPANAPVRLPDLVLGVVGASVPPLQAGKSVSQNTDLIGFCTQEETPYEKEFKQMVENMEKELHSGEYLVEKSGETVYDCQVLKTKSLEKNLKIDSPVFENEDRCYELDEKTSEISKMQLVEFLHLGRLTPARRRTKSTVVKLVFPIGLTSLARRHAFENRCFPVTKKQTYQVSTGIQTSQETVSCLVQTSQVPQSSFNMQTSQEMRPSVEIQTTQKWGNAAEIQTSERLVCQEIQTSQTLLESAQVQTTQPPFSFNSNSKSPQTPVRRPSHQHKKIVQKENYEETFLNSPIQLFPVEEEAPDEKDLIMDFGVEKDFEETCRIKQKHEHLVEMKNKKNAERNKKPSSIRQKSADFDSDDSDVQPPRRKGSYRIFSQNSTRVLEHKTRHLIPLNVRKVSGSDEVEVIDLDTPESQNSEEQVRRVLKNIDLDLAKGRNGNVKGERSEESDSDFFVEQTPPRPTSRAIDDIKNLSRPRSGSYLALKQPETKETKSEKKENSENSDLICDSIPKGFSESFQLFTAPQRIPLTPEKISKDETQKKTSKTETTVPIDLPDENDQNQLNAFDGKAKTAILKAVVGAWKQTEPTVIVKTTPTKKLCVVASSVKNPDLIKKFVSKFKIEYLNKPTKDMTHLIVGLHENEDKEVLPLCTPKLLFAMANKKWVVSELWAESCLKANTLLPEETFETLDPVGGCGCLKARLSSEKLLKHCEIYLLGEFQMISKEEFADLVSDCGGILVPTPEKFSFLPTKLRMIIADRDSLKMSDKQLQDLYQKHSTVILSRDVIIMSIQSYKLVNFFPYLLHLASEENLVNLGYPLHLVKNEEEEEEEEEVSNGAFAR